MRLKLLEVWRRIRRGFWFLPSTMVLAAAVLAFANLYLDGLLSAVGGGPPAWLAVAGAESARSLLSTVATSMMTVAGVTFSIVIVALTLASSQFGPRLLTGFMKDTGNQVALGTFVSVFLYCLLVLAHLPGASGSRALPQISVLTSIVLAVLALGVLIFFFHHISTSIQAGELIREAGNALADRVRASFPVDPLAEGEGEAWPPAGFSESNARVSAPASGYLSDVDSQRLADFAEEQGCRILIVPRAGDFLLRGEDLALVTPPEALGAAGPGVICGAVSVVRKRDDGADLLLAVERITEIAVRGLSPGINDPYTARRALYQLAAGFDLLLSRLPASCVTRDRRGSPRLYLRPPEVADLLELALGPIRTYGRQDVRVLEAMLDCLGHLGGNRHHRWRPQLLAQVEAVAATARAFLRLEAERTRVEALYERVWGRLKA